MKTNWICIALSLAALLGVWQKAHAQDIHSSQFYMTSQGVNPAANATINKFDGFLTQRKQWASVTVPFVTYSAGFGGQINELKRSHKGHWGAGGYAFSDVGGDGSLKTNFLGLNGVYHVRLSRYEKLGMGLQAGLGSKSIDYTNLKWGSQYSGTAYNSALPVGETLDNNSLHYLDFNAGMMYSLNNNSGNIKVTGNHFKQATAGIAFQHLNRPQVGFMAPDRLYIKMTMHGQALWSLEKTPLALMPALNFSKQGPHTEFIFGSNVRYELATHSEYTALIGGSALYVGLFYRVRDSFVFTGMLEFGSYQFGVSYDLNTSKLNPATGGRGGMEFTLRFTEKKTTKLVNAQE